MEDFICDIYQRANLLEQFREISEKMQKMLVEGAGVQWNKAVVKLQQYMEELGEFNLPLANRIINIAEKVCEAYRDPALFAALIEAELIPAFLEYISDYNGIDVTEGRYHIQSSKACFLSLYDSIHDIYIHSPYDPMWEAHVLAEILWNPQMEEFHIFGSGFGYLAYQIWEVSEKSTKIVIYEDSDEIVQYALQFGLLSWISSDYLEIVVNSDKKVLSDIFHKKTDQCNKGKYISTWMGLEYQKYDNGELAYERMNADACRWFYNLWGINIRENRKRVTTSIGELRKRLNSDRWIVVAAGPSLEQSITFIKESIGEKKIVAVDVVLKRLLQEGIRPDLLVIGDPKDQMLRHIEGLEDETEKIPLIADRLSNWRYLNAYKGPIALMTAQNSIAEFGKAEDDKEAAWNIGGTVASLAIETAVRFGARKVWLAGLDLAYPDGKHFVEGTLHEKNNLQKGSCMVESMDGGYVETSKTFLYFKRIIEKQISQYPQISFINLSRHGARISGCHAYLSEKEMGQ